MVPVNTLLSIAATAAPGAPAAATAPRPTPTVTTTHATPSTPTALTTSFTLVVLAKGIVAALIRVAMHGMNTNMYRDHATLPLAAQKVLTVCVSHNPNVTRGSYQHQNRNTRSIDTTLTSRNNDT